MASGEGNHHHGDLGPDPFAPTPTRKLNAFEVQLLSPNHPNGLATSPEEAKAQLLQLIAENERKIEEAGKLGTTLVNTHNELKASLEEVEVEGQRDGEISDELARRLRDIEREFTEAGRDSSRILAAKSRASSGEMGAHPFEPKVFTSLFMCLFLYGRNDFQGAYLHCCIREFSHASAITHRCKPLLDTVEFMKANNEFCSAPPVLPNTKAMVHHHQQNSPYQTTKSARMSQTSASTTSNSQPKSQHPCSPK